MSISLAAVVAALSLHPSLGVLSMRILSNASCLREDLPEIPWAGVMVGNILSIAVLVGWLDSLAILVMLRVFVVPTDHVLRLGSSSGNSRRYVYGHTNIPWDCKMEVFSKWKNVGCIFSSTCMILLMWESTGVGPGLLILFISEVWLLLGQ